MFRKVLLSGRSAQEKFLKGVEIIDEMVGGTLGVGGRNRLVQRKYKSPLVINDGATIARHIVLDDPIEDMAAQVLIELSMKTAEQAGDGTTTATVLGCELTRTGIKLLTENKSEFGLAQGESPMRLLKKIQEEKNQAVEILKKMAQPMDNLEDVIATSLENLEYGKTLAELYKTVGDDGYISVEENWATKYGITTETVTGMKFLGKYATPFLARSANRKEAIWDDALVLVTNQKMETTLVLKQLFEEMNAAGKRKLVIINGYSRGTDPFSEDFVRTIAKEMYKITDPKVPSDSIFHILAVKAQSLTSDELEDVAVFCDAKFFDERVGTQLRNATIEGMGFARKISVTEDEVNIIGGRGNTDERIGILKAQLEKEKDQMFAEKIKRRIASLASGVGIIRVGANTESERSYLKYKLEDAVLALKAAKEEGIVPGGGIALKKVAEELGRDAILYSTLMSPYERIQRNAGGVDIPGNIVDPLKVVRIALENAVSGAGMLITADGAIAEEKLDFMDYMEKAFKKLVPRDERDSFRDSENQDLGTGRFVD